MKVQPVNLSSADQRDREHTSHASLVNPGDMHDPGKNKMSQSRSIAVGSRVQSEKFATNAVKTSIYTPFNFLPKNLFKQFTRFSNVYFLFITALQLIPEVTSTPGFPTMVVPLVFIIVVSAVRDLVEDLDRHRSDSVQNRARVSKLNLDHSTVQPPFVNALCADLTVGDLVRVSQNEELPADVALLACSHPSGQCFVMTANLDGESSLKPRYVHPQLCQAPYGPECFTPDGALTQDGVPRIREIVVDCEAPNRRIDRFEGSIHLPMLNKSGESDHVLDLDITHVMLKGTQVKDTAWIIGVVVYTGDDTRVRQNSSDTPIKLSWLYRFINKITLWVVLAQIVILVVAVVIEKRLMSSPSVLANPYIDEDVKNSDTLDLVYLFLAYMLLFSNFVPISLQVTIDFTRYFQALVIQRDPDMNIQQAPSTPVKKRKSIVGAMTMNNKRRSVRVQSSELNEELGLVEYVFTDKTGTLTCNRMEFRTCHIDGETFDFDTATGTLKAAPTDDSISSLVDQVSSVSSSATTPRSGASTSKMKFLMNLAVNNSISPSSGLSQSARQAGPSSSPEAELSGPSPDEKALVSAAARLGVKLIHRDNSHLAVRVADRELQLQIVQLFEFTSDRKKSSILCRHPDGKLILYCKGADTVILASLSDQNAPDRIHQAKEQMKSYSADGLRVLCIAERVLSEDEYAAWNTRYLALRAAKKKSKDKQPKADDESTSAINALVSELECDLMLVGISAIEDKIQEGAPETLEKFREAGVKVWMLTGDRPDTATNVGYAVRLISSEMKLIKLTDPQQLESRQSVLDFLEHESKMLESSDFGGPLLIPKTAPSIDLTQAPVRCHSAMIVSDVAVEAIQQFHLEDAFLRLATQCESVLCARISPKQKEFIVQMVRSKFPNKVTMAVGDGANDVPMIQRAHIGVGIAGEEGNQASDASDYSIPAFRFLQKLVLVHGRWMNRRIAVLTLYIFYKNVLLVLPQFVYGIYCLFSGQSSYYDPLLQLFNICFTSLPVMYFSVFDQDISATTTLRYPRLYQDGSSHAFLNKRVFAYWMFEATVASVLIILVPAKLIPLVPWSGTGKDNDLWSLGLTQNFIVVFLANARLLVETSTSHGRMLSLTTVSVLLWWGIVYGASTFGREFYGILRVGSLTTLALCTLFCTCISLGVALVPRVLDVLIAPHPRTICRELDFMTGTKDMEYLTKRQPTQLQLIAEKRAIVVPT